MIKKQNGIQLHHASLTLSLGERVSRHGAFSSRHLAGEGISLVGPGPDARPGCPQGAPLFVRDVIECLLVIGKASRGETRNRN